MGWAIFGSFLNFCPFQGQVMFCCSQSRVFSWAMIVAPAVPSLSLEPVCSRMPVRVEQRLDLAGYSAAPRPPAPARRAFCASPPSTITTPSEPVCAITFPPAPLSRYRFSPSGAVGDLGGLRESVRRGQAHRRSFEERPTR